MSGEFMSVDPSRLGGNLVTENFHTLGEYSGLGVGSIDPAERTDVDPEKYRALLEDLARGEFNVPVERGIDYVKWCIDGRTREGVCENRRRIQRVGLFLMYTPEQ